jgi:aspartate ammonia-lyase
MTQNRVEHDLLGNRELPADALYGIHTLRAIENFPLSGRAVRQPLIRAYATVKQACALANRELGGLVPLFFRLVRRWRAAHSMMNSGWMRCRAGQAPRPT